MTVERLRHSLINTMFLITLRLITDLCMYDYAVSKCRYRTQKERKLQSYKPLLDDFKDCIIRSFFFFFFFLLLFVCFVLW